MEDKKPFDKISYNNKFNEERYDRFSLMLPKGLKEELKLHAEIYDGGSVNAFVQRAIREQLKRDADGEFTN
jgi:hypothetical protein